MNPNTGEIQHFKDGEVPPGMRPLTDEQAQHLSQFAPKDRPMELAWSKYLEENKKMDTITKLKVKRGFQAGFEAARGC